MIELAAYPYSHGEDIKEDGTTEGLRKLVVDSIACEISTFGQDGGFLGFLEGGGEVASDLWGILAKTGYFS